RVRDGTAEYRWLSGKCAGRVEHVGCADPLEAVRAELERRTVAPVPGLPRFSGGAVGYLAYEVAACYEPSVPIPACDPLGLPDAVFLFTDTLLAFDHVRHRALLLTYAELNAADGDAQQVEAEAQARLDAMERRLSVPLPRPRHSRNAAKTATAC